MEVGGVDESVLAARWAPLQMILSRPTKFGMETGALKLVEGMDFEPDEELHAELTQGACVLCVGAGGLGCEILKDLALSGFQNIHVIDLDTIDVTNLNRQFLFRKKDVGKSKAQVAADFINLRIPGVKVTPHHGKLQDFSPEWYKQFNVVIAGLDNLEARRWLNQVLCSLVQFEDGQVDPSTIIPLVDGGTEGLKGQSRLILPMVTSCFQCTMDLFPPAKGKAVCTLENHPRVPADCAIYVYMKVDDTESQDTGAFDTQTQVFLVEGPDGLGKGGIVVQKHAADAAAAAADITYDVRLADGTSRTGVAGEELQSIRQHWVSTFGQGAKLDKDSRLHMMWIHNRAADRAALFGIPGLTYDKTMGAVKNIIPAVASTNAIIAAASVNEAIKCLSFSGQLCNTYMLYNGVSVENGVDCNVLDFERLEDCSACAPSVVVEVKVKPDMTVQGLVDFLKTADLFNIPLSQPQLFDEDGDMFYVETGPLAKMKQANLAQPLSDFVDDTETIMVMDNSWGKDIKRNVKVTFG